LETSHSVNDNVYGDNGSGFARQTLELIAVNLPFKFRCRLAAVG
jgi:hypothetical protein